MTITRVLLVDDQDMMRAGLRMLLNAEPDIEVIAEAAGQAEAVELALRELPDVVVMDVRLESGKEGVDAAAEILAAPEFTGRVLMLTTFESEAAIRAAFRAGVSGFLLKHADPTELINAVRAIATGDAAVSPEILRRLMTDYGSHDPQPAAPSENAKLSTLTAREREILVLVASGLSNSEIGTQLFISQSTVKTHVSNVLAKLGLRDRLQAAIFASEHNLLPR